ncbi:hypothetical protein [Chitinophaga sp. YIM B06452]|uniref:hypothetical protein n=1 Tax=Chitinophaga sp. YIM B06452 TaxID=3082158 RepID=UPI0031FE9AAA
MPITLFQHVPSAIAGYSAFKQRMNGNAIHRCGEKKVMNGERFFIVKKCAEQMRFSKIKIRHWEDHSSLRKSPLLRGAEPGQEKPVIARSSRVKAGVRRSNLLRWIDKLDIWRLLRRVSRRTEFPAAPRNDGASRLRRVSCRRESLIAPQ